MGPKLVEDGELRLRQLSVVLVPQSLDPSHLNIDFLRVREIIPADLQSAVPPISTPAFSQVVLQGGLSVIAVPDRVTFTQDQQPGHEQLVPSYSRRYVEALREVRFTALGINPVFARTLADSDERVLYSLSEHGAWTTFKDQEPQLALRLSYEYEARQIVIEVSPCKVPPTQPGAPDGISFSANIHRNIKGSASEVVRYIDNWKDDMEDVLRIAEKFCSERFCK